MLINGYRAVIKTWIENELSNYNVEAQWVGDKGGWHNKSACAVRMHLHSSRSVGVDHLRWEQDTDEEDGLDYIPTVSGNREITLTIFAKTRAVAVFNDGKAIFFLEKLRTSLHKPSVKSNFRAVNLALIRAESAVDLSSIYDNRIEDYASLDVHFNAVVNEQDYNEADSFAEKAVTTAELASPSGADVGWADEELP